MTEDKILIRLQQIMKVVEKENVHLQAVKKRLFVNDAEFDEKSLSTLLNSPEGEDRLESFGSKFARMQDTVIDKLLPALLTAAGEKPASAIDNLNRAERLGLLTEARQWVAMRRLRNKLVHEYIDSDEEMLPALNQAKAFSCELESTFLKIKEFSEKSLSLSF